MNDALYVAATGMQAHQSSLTAIANNVANVNTPGFKRGRVEFQDLMVQSPVQAEAAPAADTAAVLSAAGVAASMRTRVWDQGELRPSGEAMTLAIQGAGFLELSLPDGSTALTRGGRLTINADKLLANADGVPLKQRIQMDADLSDLRVSQDGVVSATDTQGREQILGRLELVQVNLSQGMENLGAGLFKAPANSTDVIVSQPGEAGAGWLRQGFEEASNVKLVDEMVQLMVAQRAYEMNVKLVQAADEFAGMANNLRR